MTASTAGPAPAAGQQWNPADYARNGRFVADLAAPLLLWLDARPGERVLDLGCGDGALSEQIAATGAVVQGFDASAELAAAARARGVPVDLGDAQDGLPYVGQFDAVFSNAALHWMRRDADAVLRAVYQALRPGGRFIAEMGGAGNIAALRGALYDALAARGVNPARVDPWYFPSVNEYRQRLVAAGFEVVQIESYPRPTPLPGDVAGWLRTFAQAFLSALPGAAHAAVLEEMREALRPHLCDARGTWTADYVRLRFIAHKPAL